MGTISTVGDDDTEGESVLIGDEETTLMTEQPINHRMTASGIIDIKKKPRSPPHKSNASKL
jgi:hypothetical protein